MREPNAKTDGSAKFTSAAQKIDDNGGYVGSINLISFSGIAPKLDNRKLPEGAAQMADNCRLMSGGLRSFADKLDISTNLLKTGGDIKTIFRMTNGVYDYWLSWLTDVDCVRGQIAGDTLQRIYWTGDNEPRMSDFIDATNNAGSGIMPDVFFVLGVPAPLVAPTVTPSGGSGAALTRAYVETFVTPLGEESAPSPVTLVTGLIDTTTWALTALNDAPINTSSISAITVSSGVATATTASTKYLRVGEELTIAGVVGMTDANGSRIITEVTDATHFKFLLTTAQTYTSGGTWTRAAPHNTTGMTRRIYRTLNGKYYFVAEIAVTTTSYNDTLADTALGEEIPSVGWSMPPVGMKGMIALPNGFNAAFSGNEVLFSEPWYPHAWPDKYKQSCNFDVMALGAFGSSIAVGTKGYPYVMTGAHPASISMEKTEVSEPCMSKRGMVDVGAGVLYPSPNGLVFIGVGQVTVITASLFTRDEWLLLNPASMRCDFHNGMVFGWHDINAEMHTGFTFNRDTGAFASTSLPVTSSYVDPETTNMYVVKDGAIYQWDAHPYNNLSYDWKSRAYYQGRPINFGYAKIDAYFDQLSKVNAAIAADLAWNTAILASGLTYGELDNSMLDYYMLDGSELVGGSIAEYATLFLRFSIYADGVEKYSENVESNKTFSLPSGFKADRWEFRISGNIPVYSAFIAESATELRQMS